MASAENCKTRSLDEQNWPAMKLPRGIYERDGILYIRFQDGRGKIVRESTHQSSVKIALEILSKRKTEVAEGTFFPARRFEKVMFAELEQRWWKEHGQYTRSCLRYLRNRMRRNFGSLRAKDIQVPSIRTFFAELESHGYSSAYINSHRTMLNSIFNYAVKTREYDRNQIQSIPQLRERDERDFSPSRNGAASWTLARVIPSYDASLSLRRSPQCGNLKFFADPGEKCTWMEASRTLRFRLPRTMIPRSSLYPR